MFMPICARQIWLRGPSCVLEGLRRQFFFVRAPAHFGRGGPFFAKAFDAPGVDEFVDLLGLVGDLRVALGAMNHLHAQLHGQAIERRDR